VKFCTEVLTFLKNGVSDNHGRFKGAGDENSDDYDYAETDYYGWYDYYEVTFKDRYSRIEILIKNRNFCPKVEILING